DRIDSGGVRSGPIVAAPLRDARAPPVEQRAHLVADDAGAEPGEDADAGEPIAFARGRRARAPRGEREGERGARAFTALDRQRSAEEPAEALGDREPQSGAADLPVGAGLDLAEPLKELVLEVGGNAAAGIADADRHVRGIAIDPRRDAKGHFARVG